MVCYVIMKWAIMCDTFYFQLNNKFTLVADKEREDVEVYSMCIVYCCTCIQESILTVPFISAGTLYWLKINIKGNVFD